MVCSLRIESLVHELQTFFLDRKIMTVRKKLAKDAGVRKRFSARVVRLGKKINFKGYSEETILLAQITDVSVNEVVADHLWFTFSLTFQKANPAEGSLIEFDARVTDYQKGYVNKSLGINKRHKDFKLSHPTNIKLVTSLPR
jgi:hypothetical protein